MWSFASRNVPSRIAVQAVVVPVCIAAQHAVLAADIVAIAVGMSVPI
jgi:hypothetical protein